MAEFNGFICDSCKKEYRAGQKEYCPISIALYINFGSTSRNGNSSYSYEYPDSHQIWCRECIMKKGIHKPTGTDDKKIAPENELSFEEKFSILIEEMGFNREE